MNLPSLMNENDCGCVERVGPEDSGCLCAASGIVQILGRRHSLRLLSLVADQGAARFSELRAEMGDISSSTLTIRLAELESAGLIERRTFAEIPPRVEYSLTKEGEGLRKRLLSLSRFAARRREQEL